MLTTLVPSVGGRARLPGALGLIVTLLTPFMAIGADRVQVLCNAEPIFCAELIDRSAKLDLEIELLITPSPQESIHRLLAMKYSGTTVDVIVSRDESIMQLALEQGLVRSFESITDPRDGGRVLVGGVEGSYAKEAFDQIIRVLTER